MMGVACNADDQIARIEMVAERTQQSARAFNQQHIKPPLHHADVRQHLGAG